MKIDFSILRDPLALNFLIRFSKVGNIGVKQHALANYILESIMLDYSLVGMPGSLAAASSLYLALKLLKEDGQPVVWTPALAHYTGYQLDQVMKKTKAVTKALRKIHKMHYGVQFSAVKEKFSSKSMLQIATNPTIDEKINLFL